MEASGQGRVVAVPSGHVGSQHCGFSCVLSYLQINPGRQGQRAPFSQRPSHCLRSHNLCGSRPLTLITRAVLTPGLGSRPHHQHSGGWGPQLAWLTYADVLVPIIDQPLVDLIGDAHHSDSHISN